MCDKSLNATEVYQFKKKYLSEYLPNLDISAEHPFGWSRTESAFSFKAEGYTESTLIHSVMIQQ